MFIKLRSSIFGRVAEKHVSCVHYCGRWKFSTKDDGQVLEQMNKEFSGWSDAFKEDHQKNERLSRILHTFMRHARVERGSDEILDVACGPGITTVAMAKEDPLRIIGVDIAEGMLQTAEQHAREHGVDSRVSFQLCNAAELPFPNESFSLVTQRLGFHHFHEYQRVFAEMARVCRKGGRIVIMDVTVESDNGGDPSEAAIALNTAIHGLQNPTHHRFLLDHQIEAMAEHNGLKDFHIADNQLRIVYDIESLVRQTGSFDQRWAVVPLAESLMELGIDTGTKLSRDERNGRVQFTVPFRVWTANKPR